MRPSARNLLLAAAAAAALTATAVGAPAVAATSGSKLPVLDPAGAQFTTLNGANPVSSTKTVPTWHGQFTDPTNGLTYGYNMVGVDPASNGSASVPVDIIPLNISFQASGGYALNGTDVVARTVASPIFQTGDYSSTAEVSGPADSSGHVSAVPGGTLSPGNTGVQYEDAIMRSQFNKTGTSYHLRLNAPVVWPAVSLSVPASQGAAYQSSLGAVFGLTNGAWFDGRIMQLLNQLHLDPTHLPVFLTNNVMVYLKTTANCCIIGYHGAGEVNGHGTGSSNGQGNQAIQTFAFASYTAPGTFDPAFAPFLRDVHALSHEIAEWGDDPFGTNKVDPWLTPTAPQYGCSSLMETGDPVVGIGFTMPGNTFDTGALTDGYYHPEDEVFLPWFARQSPNTTSQLTQSGNGGRYTFMGDLNPYQGFRQPATGC